MADNPKEPYGPDANYADPGYQSDGKKRYPCDTQAHTRAAWSYINQAENRSPYTADQLARIEAHIKAAGKKFGITFADEPEKNERTLPLGEIAPVGEIETRAIGSVASVDVDHRIVTMIAVPYGELTPVLYKNQIWNETFERDAFKGFAVNDRKDRRVVTVNREHERRDLVGRVVEAWPDRPEGLVCDAFISRTALGDDTLQLARDGILGASVGFGLRKSSDAYCDRATGIRHINRAFLQHLSLVGEPAYAGAKVLGVRRQEIRGEVPTISSQPTPNLDMIALDPVIRKAKDWVRR